MYRKCVNALLVSFITLGLFCTGISEVFAEHYGDMYPLVGASVGTRYPYAVDIARDPNDVPLTPLPNGATVEITADEVPTYLAPKDFADDWAGDGTDVKFKYFAFGGGQTSVTVPKVPGPFIRVREGNTVTVILTNNGNETHSIDLHAVLGKKGGGAVLMAAPGESKEFTFVAGNPGIYVYHCVGMGMPHGIAHHMNNGMFGLILVEPSGRGSWNSVLTNAKEFYVFEQDIYVGEPHEPHEEDGPIENEALDFDEDSMLANESPNYVVYNGRVGALVDHPLVAQAGKNAIIYHGAAGQSIPSFHIIGEIFDWIWVQGDLTSKPLRNIQTTLVPSSGAIAVGLKGSDLIPTGNGDLNILVDHALPRFRKGALGLMVVE